MKKALHKIFAFVMMVIVGLLFVGCGPDPDYADKLKEQYENGDLTYEEYLKKRQEAMSVPLYGTKILYRPDDYDWDANVGEGNDNYYGRYAWWLLRELAVVYGYSNLNDNIVDLANNPDYDPDNTYADIYIPEFQEDAENAAAREESLKKLGFYDSIRYQLGSIDNITLQKVNIADKNSVVDAVNYVEISANTQNKWNWSLGLQAKFDDENTLYTYLTQDAEIFDGLNIDFSGKNYPIDYYYDIEGEKYYYLNGNNLKNIIYNDNVSIKDVDIVNSAINRHWGPATTNANNYLYAYLQTEQIDYDDQIDFFDYTAYGDYVKALEYAIYCINLDITPNNIQVSYDAVTAMPIVSIVGYPATAEKSSAQVALESIQETFKKVGTYVGVTERQQTKLVNWICENIIGSQSSSTFSISSTDRTLVQYVKTDESGNEVLCDENGNPVAAFSPVPSATIPPKNNAAISVDRKYQENVKAIVDICTTQVKIGGNRSEEEDSTDGPNINQRYLASNVIDFYGNDFFISGNNDFKFGAMEYQSIALMFAQDFKFSNLMLGFKYDAGDDGEGSADKVIEGASIVIKVRMHLYTKSLNRYREIGVVQDKKYYTEFQIEVPDGAFDFGGKNHTLMLFNLVDRRPEGDNGVVCGRFNPNIGDGILASITDGYTGLQNIGDPLPLSGNNARRNYYNHIEGEEGDGYYSYGVLNPEMFSGSDGCDFFEISFEVVKVKGDFNKNYKFYTGLMLVA